ncbi:hypothetical protein BDK51DRAFT_40372 [Blyttiomyces helicus]|uniref:Uncharacterized protein n=1 Tax=Blyttiomyces helicus TaxID=388810 RepID=A0A4P9W356_9FUNG|nr:hypothetical protein BDK51DRAFT_40372 [Blyttiomyces helicus]|eukprot:RKO85765.1 hypothetical protein BDK51DRAFT_40372 [Blyttiomyces helicus]
MSVSCHNSARSAFPQTTIPGKNADDWSSPRPLRRNLPREERSPCWTPLFPATTRRDGGVDDLFADADMVPHSPSIASAAFASAHRLHKRETSLTTRYAAASHHHCFSPPLRRGLLDFQLFIGTVATILDACDQLVAFIWRQEGYLPSFPFDDEDWATIERRIKTLVLFWLYSSRVRWFDGGPVLHLNQAVGPPIRHWAVSWLRGHFRASARCMRESRVRGHSGLALSWASISLTQLLHAPRSTRPRLAQGAVRFPGIEEPNLGDQTMLSNAALAPLLHHRPLKVLSIAHTSFTAPAVVALLTTRGSLLASFDFRENRWPTGEILVPIARYTPKLSALLFSNCRFLRPSHANIDLLTASFPSLQIVYPPPVDDGPLADGVRVFMDEGAIVKGISTLRLAGIP